MAAVSSTRRRLPLWILPIAALAGCAETQYTNDRRPGATRAEFLGDADECQRNNMINLETRGDPYKFPVLVVDHDRAAQCLAARGWRPVPK
jgi:hypothetical protein